MKSCEPPSTNLQIGGASLDPINLIRRDVPASDLLLSIRGKLQLDVVAGGGEVQHLYHKARGGGPRCLARALRDRVPPLAGAQRNLFFVFSSAAEM